MGPGSGLRLSREELPFSGHTLQAVATTVGEFDTGTGDQITDGVRHEHLTCIRESCDSCADMYRDAGKILSP